MTTVALNEKEYRDILMKRYCATCALFVLALLAITTLQAQQGLSYNWLVINHAQYGRKGVGADVTKKVQSMVKNHQLDFKVNNSNLGGDPNVGADKYLTVKYTYQRQTHVKVFKEGDRCQLP